MPSPARRSTYKSLYQSVGRFVSYRINAERYLPNTHVQQTKYLALSSLVSRQISDDMPLSAHELSVFSQNGEDGVLFELCRRLKPSHSFVEFGIESGTQGNCVLLADVFGWSGLFIEASQLDFERLSLKYLHHAKVKTIQAMVTPKTVESIFSEAEVPPDIGVLSIDIDGNDYWVWEAITSWQPTIVVVEINSLLSFNDPLVQPYCEDSSAKSKSSFFGASLGALVNLGRSKGYHLIHVDLTGVNAFFVRSDVAADLGSADLVARHGLNYYLLGTQYQHPASMRKDWVRV